MLATCCSKSATTGLPSQKSPPVFRFRLSISFANLKPSLAALPIVLESLGVGHAKLLFAEGRHSVTEVCMEMGFSSLDSLSTLFSRRVGVSPATHQRQARVMMQIPARFPESLFPGCLNLMAGLPASTFRNFREAHPDAQAKMPLLFGGGQ